MRVVPGACGGMCCLRGAATSQPSSSSTQACSPFWPSATPAPLSPSYGWHQLRGRAGNHRQHFGASALWKTARRNATGLTLSRRMRVASSSFIPLIGWKKLSMVLAHFAALPDGAWTTWLPPDCAKRAWYGEMVAWDSRMVRFGTMLATAGRHIVVQGCSAGCSTKAGDHQLRRLKERRRDLGVVDDGSH